MRLAVLARLSLPSAEQNRLASQLLAWEGSPFSNLVPCSSWPEDIQESFRRHNTVWQQASVFRVDQRVIIDGVSGFAFHSRRIIPSSLAYAYDACVPSWRMLLPQSEQGVVRNAISLRDPYESNYFHFFNDLLGKLFYIRKNLATLASYSLIVAEHVYASPWFQSLRSTELLCDAKLVVQRQNEPVVCEGAIFGKAPPHQGEAFRAISACARNQFGRARTFAPERLLLLRSALTSHGRIPSNQDELAARLREYGFEAVDPATLPWPEQVAVMRNCRILVGLHGAGMTNLMFRGPGPMTVVELFPKGFSPPHYYWMAELLGYRYVPKADRGDGRINVEDVVATIQMLL